MNSQRFNQSRSFQREHCCSLQHPGPRSLETPWKLINEALIKNELFIHRAVEMNDTETPKWFFIFCVSRKNTMIF
jgi:hypothetical protein